MSLNKLIYAQISGNNYSPESYSAPKDRVFIHWICGTLESALATFRNPSRGASAHYGVGPEYDYQFMPEGAVAWANGVWEQNRRSITIETEGGPNMPYNPAITEKLAQRIAKIFRDRGFGQAVVGVNLFQHKDVYPTSCAGYYGERIHEIANRVNEINSGKTQSVTAPQAPQAAPTGKVGVGSHVTFSHLWTSSNGGQKLPALVSDGVITKVIPGAEHPYLVGDGTGWLSDAEIGNAGATQPAQGVGVGTFVRFNHLWTSSSGGARLRALVDSGTITAVRAGAEHPYLVGNGTGWLSDADILGNSAPAAPTIKPGGRVVVTNPVDENGTRLYVGGVYDVIEVTGSRVVIGRGGQVTAALNINNVRGA